MSMIMTCYKVAEAYCEQCDERIVQSIDECPVFEEGEDASWKEYAEEEARN